MRDPTVSDLDHLAGSGIGMPDDGHRPRFVQEILGVIEHIADDVAAPTFHRLRDGQWKTTRILPAVYPTLAGGPRSNRHYGLLFWNNADGAMAGVPVDAYWSLGLGDSFILVIPSLDIVVARAGPRWGGRNVVAPFFTKVAAVVN